ncbi:GTP-binding protein [Clostridium senegalense]|uniref:GTP-binding protein n=1 Tax=Clostridium senegalense TaxID=1465809 RepID=A0A6M0H600_9CLOT|nr:GTP-binding protein [Clostridium senegalense]NEU05957.1 GTP-binding protein [Clostridium senegalense]
MGVKLDIISGFLGAGKTNLIKKIIKNNFLNEKIVIIENEFGEVNIDGKFLKKDNIDIKEITDGCICCTLTENFKDCIINVVESFTPDRIIIEPSGVAQLSDILKIFNDEKINSMVNVNMIITVIDGENFNEYVENFGAFYKNQIINCKSIVITKCENISQDKIKKIKDDLKNINSNANIICNSDSVQGEEIIFWGEDKNDFSTIKYIKKPKKNTSIKIKKHYRVNVEEKFENVSFKTNKFFTEKQLEDIMKKLKDNEFGNIIRAKGIVKSNNCKQLKFDYVLKSFNVVPYKFKEEGVICIIGKKLNKELLYNFFS